MTAGNDQPRRAMPRGWPTFSPASERPALHPPVAGENTEPTPPAQAPAPVVAVSPGYPGQPALGRYLREFRQARGMTIEMLAYRIGHASKSGISKMERGAYSLGPEIRAKIAAVFHVEVTGIWPASLIAEADRQRAESWRAAVVIATAASAAASRSRSKPRTPKPRTPKPPNPPKPNPPNPPKPPKPPKPPRLCKCGCGELADLRSLYKRGHSIKERSAAEREEKHRDIVTGRMVAPVRAVGVCACGCEFALADSAATGYRPGHKENPPRVTRSGQRRDL